MEQSYGVAAGILIFTSKYVYAFQYVFLMLQTLIFMLQESILNVATERPMRNFPIGCPDASSPEIKISTSQLERVHPLSIVREHIPGKRGALVSGWRLA